MKLRLTITEISDTGDSIRVTTQGEADSDGRYGPGRKVIFDAPPHIGKSYRIGQRLIVEVR